MIRIREYTYLACALLLIATQSCDRPVSGSLNKNDSSLPASATPAAESDSAPSDQMVLIKGGKFIMGTDEGFPYEAPAHEVTVNSFLIDKHEVTVAAFARFVEATGYKTEAEKFRWSGVFDVKSGEWKKVDGADWRRPDGPANAAHPAEPVTQVSWNDAVAYAKWARKRLPTEAEWEYAASGGSGKQKYSWGNDLLVDGKCMANWWQGPFPERDTGEDGFIGRAPVGKFPPNGFQLYDMVGNVWEWCSDWFDEQYYSKSPPVNPRGPVKGSERVIRGGSWMCSQNYCQGFRRGARSHSAEDSGLNNLGFRCVRDLQSQ